MSVPCPIAPIPEAVAEAAPPEEPPGVILELCGLIVWPCNWFRVNQRRENAGVFVRPMMIAPALRKLVTTGLSRSAIRFSCNFRPFVFAYPAWSMLTLTVTGTPANSPGSLPRSIAWSTNSAERRASSGVSMTTALSFPLIACRRLNADWVTSTAETWRDFTNTAISAALLFHNPFIIIS